MSFCAWEAQMEVFHTFLTTPWGVRRTERVKKSH
uniref:Uncharacterized protein n=1 Tax=Anguilla anguilla TaxID=7936 RepID=A0A0E9PSI6_ANGAN